MHALRLHREQGKKIAIRMGWLILWRYFFPGLAWTHAGKLLEFAETTIASPNAGW